MALYRERQKRKRDFAGDERGGITVEAVLWLPFYLVFIALIADVSMMFHAQAKAQRIAQDVNRLASLTWLESGPEMKARAEKLVHAFSPMATVTISYKTDRVQTFITMPSSDLQPVGLLNVFRDFDLSVSAAHHLES